MSRLYEQLNTPTKERGWRDLILLALLFGFLFFGSLGSAPLIDPDEGRYAEIPREMLEQRDFVTPTLNYVKYFEKPPLLYWLNAGSMSLLGKDEFAARFPSALAGLCTILLTYATGRRIFNRRTAMIAALILGTSTGFFLQSRIILTDMLLTLCLSAALFSFLKASGGKGPAGRRSYWLFFSVLRPGGADQRPDRHRIAGGDYLLVCPVGETLAAFTRDPLGQRPAVLCRDHRPLVYTGLASQSRIPLFFLYS